MGYRGGRIAIGLFHSNRGRTIAIKASLRIIDMVIHNAKIHQAATTERVAFGH
jgi:hypothetical protein